MRTTAELDADTAEAVESLRREHGRGLSVTAEARDYVDAWWAAPAPWVPEPGRGHPDILREWVLSLDLRSGLIRDAIVAARCIEQGLTMVSADSDFARFPGLTWINPLAQ